MGVSSSIYLHASPLRGISQAHLSYPKTLGRLLVPVFQVLPSVRVRKDAHNAYCIRAHIRRGEEKRGPTPRKASPPTQDFHRPLKSHDRSIFHNRFVALKPFMSCLSTSISCSHDRMLLHAPPPPPPSLAASPLETNPVSDRSMSAAVGSAGSKPGQPVLSSQAYRFASHRKILLAGQSRRRGQRAEGRWRGMRLKLNLKSRLPTHRPRDLR
ncbi:hypothetical protein F4677DRAFT_109450 [Hypoxylon crocopeplum]|nr:hypothetical protein F4677DRAFT_109450 [Hypoxylon crocopeplum]